MFFDPAKTGMKPPPFKHTVYNALVVPRPIGWISTLSTEGVVNLAPSAQRVEPAPPVLDLEERQWLPRHCRGDKAAFPALMAAYRRPVYAYLVRAGIGEPDRDELVRQFLKNTQQNRRPFAGIVRR